MKTEKFEGLIAAPFTPMDAGGRLNTGMIPAYYRFLEKNGISGAFVNGSTGEGHRCRGKKGSVWHRHGRNAGGMGTGKAFMKYIGMDCGTFRLPVKNPDPGLSDMFEADVKSLDIEDLLSKIP